MNKVLLAIITLGIGMILPIQAAVNGKLMRTFGHPVIGAAISFLTGTILLVTYSLTLQKPITLAAVKETNWYDWTGGIIGVIYVTGIIMIIPRLGAGFAFALIIGGQLLMSLIMDHYGMLGLAINEISWSKTIGFLLLIIGVWLIRGR